MKILDFLPFKYLYELVKKGLTLGAQEEIMKYRKLLLDQDEEIRKLKNQNKDLEDKLKIKTNVKRYNQGLFIKNSETGNPEGPYCIRCYEVSEKFISLREDKRGDKKYAYCLECKTEYASQRGPITIEVG